MSVRAGIQPFASDFRGFLFRDNNLGVRLFGTWGRNRNQWNLAYFDQLEKETNSELNLFERRKQRVLVANYYRQDFLTPATPSRPAPTRTSTTARSSSSTPTGSWSVRRRSG